MRAEEIWDELDMFGTFTGGDLMQGTISRALATLTDAEYEQVRDGICFVPASTGLWLDRWSESRDLILLEEGVDERTVLHEVAHWILGHADPEERPSFPFGLQEIEAQEAEAWAWADKRLAGGKP